MPLFFISFTSHFSPVAIFASFFLSSAGFRRRRRHADGRCRLFSPGCYQPRRFAFTVITPFSHYAILYFRFAFISMARYEFSAADLRGFFETADYDAAAAD